MLSQAFEAFLTVDQNLEFQQNVATSGIAVIVLVASTNRLKELRPPESAVRISIVALAASTAIILAAPASAQRSHGSRSGAKSRSSRSTGKAGARHPSKSDETVDDVRARNRAIFAALAEMEGVPAPIGWGNPEPAGHAPSAPQTKEPPATAGGWIVSGDASGRNRRIQRSEAAKRDFERQSGHTGGWPGHVVGHIVPLACGGADDPSNMQWQTIADGKAKDRVERQGCSSRR
jgi:hypothetical protein